MIPPLVWFTLGAAFLRFMQWLRDRQEQKASFERTMAAFRRAEAAGGAS